MMSLLAVPPSVEVRASTGVEFYTASPENNRLGRAIEVSLYGKGHEANSRNGLSPLLTRWLPSITEGIVQR